MHRLLLIFCLMPGVALSAADTLQMVKVIPWAYKSKKNNKPFFLLRVQTEGERQILHPFNIRVEDKKKPQEVVTDIFDVKKNIAPFLVDGAVLFLPRVSYTVYMRKKLVSINDTWMNAKRLYEMINKGKKAFSRDHVLYLLSDDLFDQLKRFQLYFE
ncbi:MAG: hypothetical protein WD055_04270 [Candidatus Dependentiae bacterium]